MTEFGVARVLYRVAIFAIAMVVLTLLLLQLRWVLVQVFAAVIVAAGMAPVVARATDPQRAHVLGWQPPKALVVLLIYLVVGVVVLILGSILIGAALDGANSLAIQAPQYAATIETWVLNVQQSTPILSELHLTDLFGGASGLASSAANVLNQMLGAASVLLSIFGGALNVLFVLFMALYLTVDSGRILDYVIVFLPPDRQPQTRRVMSNIAMRLSRWVVGQLLLALIIGTVAGIGLGLLGVPGAPVLAVIWMVAEFIPGIGPFIAGVPSILLGFLAPATTGILATIFTLVWSQVESNVVTPRLMGRAVELNPLVVLVALLIGNELLGLIGALFAIPAAAAIGVVIDELRQQRLEWLAGRQLAPESAEPTVVSLSAAE